MDLRKKGELTAFFLCKKHFSFYARLEIAEFSCSFASKTLLKNDVLSDILLKTETYANRFMTLPKEESKTQWSRFVAGDNEAYGWLYTKYVQRLYRYGLHFTSDGEDVKDCIHDVFTGLYRNRYHLVMPDNVKVYLFVALKNRLLRHLQNNNKYSYNEEQENVPFLLEPTVEEEYIDLEQSERQKKMIKKFLSVLSPRQKEIIYYRFIQEMQWDEICSLMTLNYQSAQNLLQRALQKIREHFDVQNGGTFDK
jgi:RNA polymerase sigma factor (sigma-70 family)